MLELKSPRLGHGFPCWTGVFAGQFAEAVDEVVVVVALGAGVLEETEDWSGRCRRRVTLPA